ncbi:hypothetical protein QJQ45_029798 [Haematococcus lacustris]|nr:hypothetical protein QJQ45_029798 [Haematococcus lacustris]
MSKEHAGGWLFQCNSKGHVVAVCKRCPKILSVGNMSQTVGQHKCKGGTVGVVKRTMEPTFGPIPPEERGTTQPPDVQRAIRRRLGLALVSGQVPFAFVNNVHLQSIFQLLGVDVLKEKHYRTEVLDELYKEVKQATMKELRELVEVATGEGHFAVIADRLDLAPNNLDAVLLRMHAVAVRLDNFLERQDFLVVSRARPPVMPVVADALRRVSGAEAEARPERGGTKCPQQGEQQQEQQQQEQQQEGQQQQQQQQEGGELQLRRARQAELAASAVQAGICRRLLHAWRARAKVRVRMRWRLKGLARRYGLGMHLHLPRCFDGKQLLQEEGKFAYAVAWHAWRLLACSWLAWQQAALNAYPDVPVAAETFENEPGYEVELFRKSAAYLASQGHTEWLPEAYGFNCSDWDYIMADLLLPASQRTCDMAFQGMSATSERIAAGYQFSGPDYASGREIMVFMSLKPDMWLFLRPFSSTVWLLMFATSAFVGICVLLTEVPLRRIIRRPGPALEKYCNLQWAATAMLLQALQQFNARSTGARIIILGYIAVLASQLTVNSINTNINGISDLVNKPVGIFVDAALMLESLRSGKVSALILDAPYVETQVAKNCDLYKVGSTVLPNGLALAFGPDVSADYIALFSNALIAMEEEGVKENLKQLFVSPASSCSNKAGGSLSSSTIGIEKLAGLWVFLGAAVGGGFTWNLLAALFARVQRARSGDEGLERRRSMSGSMSGNAILPSCESAGSMHGGIRSKSFAAMNPEMAWLGVAEASTLEEGMEVLEGHVKVMDARMKRMFEAMQQQLSAISSALQGQQDGMPGDASLQLTSKKSSGAKSLNMRSVQISLPGSEVQDVTGHISVPQLSPAAAASKLSRAASSPPAPPPTQPAPPSQRPEPRQPSPRATAAGAALAPVSGEDRAILGTATATAAAPQPAAVREGQGSPPAQHDTVLDFHDMSAAGVAGRTKSAAGVFALAKAAAWVTARARKFECSEEDAEICRHCKQPQEHHDFMGEVQCPI